MTSPDAYPNRQLVVYALFLRGGDTRRVHTEDIALKCFELFPASFSWVKYPRYPDKDIVRVALTDARKQSNGALVEGRAGRTRGLTARTQRAPLDDGWILTTTGIQWIRAHFAELEKMASAGVMREHRQQVLKQLKRIREHHLFASYSQDPNGFNPSIGDMADLLCCRVDAENTIWKSRFDRVRRQGESGSQPDILDFIARCERAYLEQR
ncbi:MAG: hypothetical protein V2A58_08825 [Planctomycetota bacterium]